MIEFVNFFELHSYKKVDMSKGDGSADGVCNFLGMKAQQHHNVFEVFYNFIIDTYPARFLEIGTGFGGFTKFLRWASIKAKIPYDITTYDNQNKSLYPNLSQYYDVDVRIEDIFNNDHSALTNFRVIEYIQRPGRTIVLCDGSQNAQEFNLFAKYIKPGDIIMAHDYVKDINTFHTQIYGKIWNWCEVSEDNIINACKENSLVEYNQDVFQKVAWACRIKKLRIS